MWEVKYTKKFLKELSNLPNHVQSRVEAIAISNQITLVTENTAHYQRIQDFGFSLLLNNWRRSH